MPIASKDGVRAWFIVLTLSGCSYKPGSFAYPGADFPGTRTQVGCLDLAVERRGDYEGAAVLGYTFGNHCNQPAIVDLAYAHVTGRTEAGNEVTLSPYDPKNELRVLRLDARSAGKEALAYNADGAPHLVSICVDLATIAHAEGTNVVCFASDAPPAPKSEG